ncbi:MAG: glycerate kinase, partial [Nitrosomonas sp.]|nr:glycerate kinase [Nitrosomonas sp.]
PGSAIFKNVENRIISSARHALNSADNFFHEHGIATAILGDTVTGEARDVAKVYAALAMEIRRYSKPWKPPIALLSGGETTVTVKGNGRGGRNTEFLLSLAIELNGIDNIYAIACDTDGIDGLEDNAGAILTPNTWLQAEKMGINARRLLAQNDSYHFFEPLNDLVITGPTYTNVNDYRAILIL